MSLIRTLKFRYPGKQKVKIQVELICKNNKI